MELRKRDMPPIMTPAPAGHTAARHRAALRAALVLLLSGSLLAFAGCDVSWPWADRTKNSTILLSGTVDAHEVDLSFQASGRILRLDTDEGRAVAVGAELAVLDPRDYELALARARAQAASAERALAALKAGSRVQDVRGAEAALRQAEADLRFARTQQERTAKFVAEHFSPPQQLDTANDQVEVATSKLEQAREGLSLLRRSCISKPALGWRHGTCCSHFIDAKG